jgi:hypothetical protein
LAGGMGKEDIIITEAIIIETGAGDDRMTNHPNRA